MAAGVRGNSCRMLLKEPLERTRYNVRIPDVLRDRRVNATASDVVRLGGARFDGRMSPSSTRWSWRTSDDLTGGPRGSHGDARGARGAGRAGTQGRSPPRRGHRRLGRGVRVRRAMSSSSDSGSFAALCLQRRFGAGTSASITLTLNPSAPKSRSTKVSSRRRTSPPTRSAPPWR